MAKKIGDASMLSRRASGFLIVSLLSIACLMVCSSYAYADTLDASEDSSTAVTGVMAASTEQAGALDQAVNDLSTHDQTAGDQTTSDQAGTQTGDQAGDQTANNPTGDQVAGDQTGDKTDASGDQAGDKTDVADQPTTPVNKPERAGWMQDADGSWYYYTSVNVAPSTGWLKVKGTWYYLDPADNGKMKTGKFSDGKANYIAAPTGAMHAKQWVKLDSDWYYATSSGALKSGWQKSSGKWYWLQGDKEGLMATDAWIADQGKRYYVDTNGVMKTGWIKSGDDWYYANKSGAQVQNGWVKVKNKWYWMQGDKQGLMAASQWITDQGKRYYFTDSGAMATKWIKDGNDWYYANNSGAQVANGWIKSGGKWYWLQGDKEGLMAADQWITDKGKRYYLTNDGSMAKKWIHVGNDWYYASNSGAQVMNGWIKSGGKWYWLQGDKEGLMLVDAVQTIDGKQYSFDGSGAMRANTAVELGDNKVGYATSSGAIVSVGTKEDGKLILRNAQGAALTGWQKIGGVWFYGDEGGVAHTGWLELKGKKYWMDSNGVMATGVRTIDGKRYVFSPSGAYTRVSAAHAATFERALKELESCTNASMTKEQKLRAAFDHIRNDFREYNPRIPHMKSVGWESIYADDIFVGRGGNCLSCAAAMAFMAKAAGYENVYACNSGGHGWAEVDGLVYDPEWSRHNAGNYFARPYGQSGGPGYAGAISSGQAWMRVAI